MKIQEFISIAEEFYGNDKQANEQNSDLWFIKYYAGTALDYYYKKLEVAKYGLTQVELLSIIMMIGKAFNTIQVPAFNPNRVNAVTLILINALDSALIKIPKTNEKLLYRYENDYEYETIRNIGQHVTIKGYFTTSIDYLYEAKYIKWVITPLDFKLTKAHEIYRVYNHGPGAAYPELQIEFERGLTFEVTAIEESESIRIIHISEIKELT